MASFLMENDDDELLPCGGDTEMTLGAYTSKVSSSVDLFSQSGCVTVESDIFNPESVGFHDIDNGDSCGLQFMVETAIKPGLVMDKMVGNGLADMEPFAPGSLGENGSKSAAADFSFGSEEALFSSELDSYGEERMGMTFDSSLASCPHSQLEETLGDLNDLPEYGDVASRRPVPSEQRSVTQRNVTSGVANSLVKVANGNSSSSSSNSPIPSRTNAVKRPKGSCIFDSLLQRGLEAHGFNTDLSRYCVAVGAKKGPSTGGHQTELDVGAKGMNGEEKRLDNSTLTLHSHRKARKPVKLPDRSSHSDHVIISASSRPMSSTCSDCSFVCNTDAELSEHVISCHSDKPSKPATRNLFNCSVCKMQVESREELRSHLGQHPGNHIFRCFTCPYCGLQADNMDTMDDHISVNHPLEDFRFEVAQERVNFMQNMLECPVCCGLYSWQNQFLSHVVTVHKLDELASYLKNQFPATPAPSSCQVPRHLFEGFADMLTEAVSPSLENSCVNNVLSVSKEISRKDMGSSSEYVRNMEKIVDQLLYQQEPDGSIKETMAGGNSNVGFTAKANTKDIWSKSERGQNSYDSPKVGPLSVDCTDAQSTRLHSTATHHQDLERSVTDWRDYRDDGVSTSAGDVERNHAGLADADGFYHGKTREVSVGFPHRTIHRCKLCPFVCDRTPNYRRHMAIHEQQAKYPDRYQCAYCHFQHHRLNCIRFHLGKYHSQQPVRIRRILNGIQVAVLDAADVLLNAKPPSSLAGPDGSFAHAAEVEGDHHHLGAGDVASELFYGHDGGNDFQDSSDAHQSDIVSPSDGSVREKRLIKPPNRLSDALDYQFLSSMAAKHRRSSCSHSDNGSGIHSPPAGDAVKTENAANWNLLAAGRAGVNRSFDDNIAEDYYHSSLPPGMIYTEPLKCPRCDFTNRVRINLVRHMKHHHNEDEMMKCHKPPPAESQSFIASLLTGTSVKKDLEDAHESRAALYIGKSERSISESDVPVTVKIEPETKWYGAIGKQEISGYSVTKCASPGKPSRTGLDAATGDHPNAFSGWDKTAEAKSESVKHGDIDWLNRKRTAPGGAFTADELLLHEKGDVYSKKLDVPFSDGAKPDRMRSLQQQPTDDDMCKQDADGQNGKRLFKCAYCAVSSRWNRRDISLHILHVHIRRRAFRCRRCGYSTSKSAAAVSVHCARTHPGRPAIIEDNLPLLNSILPVHSRPGLVHVAFRRSDGNSILSLVELEKYFGLHHEEIPPSPLSQGSLSKLDASSCGKQLMDRLVPADYSKETASSHASLSSPLDLSACSASEQPISAKSDMYSGRAATDKGICEELDLSNKSAPDLTGGSQPLKFYKPMLMSRAVLPEHIQQTKSRVPTSTVNAMSSAQKLPPQLSAPDLKLNGASVSPAAAAAAAVSQLQQQQQSANSSNHTSNAAFYRCRQCGYQDARHDKTKYHVVREHLHLGPYGCVYCPRYMWGRRHVARHIDSAHPGMPIRIRRAFDEFENYLRANIRKIGGMPERLRYSNNRSSPALGSVLPAAAAAALAVDVSTTAVQGEGVQKTASLECAPASLDTSSHAASTKTAASFQCGHCEFRDAMAARVQGHCLAKHPSKPVSYRRCEGSENVGGHRASPRVDSIAHAQTTGLKIESIESLSSGSHQKFTVHGAQSDFGPMNAPPVNKNNRNGVLETSDLRFAGKQSCRFSSDNCIQLDSESIPSSDENEGNASDVDSFPTYACQYCPEMAWTEFEIKSHISTAHPGHVIKFSFAANDDLHNGNKAAKTVVQDNKSSMLGGMLVYRCRMCRYHSDKITVVRHHVMSHLQYHPYRCPYCDTVRSVKSSPITKHVRTRHPNQEQTFVCVRDDSLERQVRKGYYQCQLDDMKDLHVKPLGNFRAGAMMPVTNPSEATPWSEKVNPSDDFNHDNGFLGEIDDLELIGGRLSTGRKTLFRCKFCGLQTYVKTDMKHHLMREIGYKPFRCGHCHTNGGASSSGYAEPSKSAMGKHFRMRHAGMTIDILDMSDPAKDAEIRELLNGCLVIDDGQNKDGSAWNSSALHATAAATHEPTMVRKFGLKMRHNVDSLKQHHEAIICKHALSNAGTAENKVAKLPPLPPLINAPAVPALSTVESPSKKFGGCISGGGPRVRRCKFCSHTSTDSKALAQHVAVRHRPRSLRCAYCDHTAHYPSWLRKHTEKAHPNMPFKFVQYGHGSNGGKVVTPALSVPRLSHERNTPPPLTSEATSDAKVSPVSEVVDRNSDSSLSILDGVEVNIPLITDGYGLFRCPDCAYQTSNKAHYRMHVMIHRPRKWQCIYCQLKFPLLFRLRHHYVTKHPTLPLRWLDLNTGQICDRASKCSADATSGQSSLDSSMDVVDAAAAAAQTPPPPVLTPAVPLTEHETQSTTVKKCIARKSTTQRRSTSLRVAMFRCGDHFSIRPLEQPQHQPMIVGGESDSEGEAESGSDSTWFCCHLCTYRTDDVNAFWNHFSDEHDWGGMTCDTSLPRVTLLQASCGGSSGAAPLQQCTGCKFETRDMEQFAGHVADVHGLGHGPKLCNVCSSFASFSDVELQQHVAMIHREVAAALSSGCSFWEPLSNRPYSVDLGVHCTASKSTNFGRISSLRVSPQVVLSEISPFSESESDIDSE